MTEKLINYFEKQQQLFTEYYNESRKYYTINSVHEMRLCMKRLRALFLFFEALEPDIISTKVLLSRFRKLFKLAGRIRDIQIQKKLALHLETELEASFIEYIHFLNKNEKKAIKAFEKKMHGYEPEKDFSSIRNLISDTLSSYPSDDLSLRGKQIIFDKFVLVQQMTREKLNSTQLHAIRTKLKQIAYLLKIWKGHENVTQVIPVERTQLQATEVKLGLWHDYVIAQMYIKKYLATLPEDKPIPVHYALLLSTAIKNRKSLASEIKPQLKSLFETELKEPGS
ncbi:MAG: CHAD domain-containing protein [Bacteroidota bacterium]|nr:CHAD domain-containing protein [Bacteroidota bacterium]